MTATNQKHGNGNGSPNSGSPINGTTPTLTPNPSERGQALLLFTLSAAAMLGMLGLALDVGWAYFVNRSAQTAVDAAALGGVRKAAEVIGAGGVPQCGPLGCQQLADCPGSGNLQVACPYAAANGFTNGRDSGRQIVRVAASNTGTAPGVPAVPSEYWVQFQTQHYMPKWFAKLFGMEGFQPGARATAALRKINLDASLYILNRKTDCFASLLGLGVVCGEDFLALGFNDVKARGGIHMASSNGSGLGLPNVGAATVTGTATVDAPFTFFMGGGGVQTILGATSWTPTPINGLPDGDNFTDPMAGKGQPPPPTSLPNHPVPGGVITGSLFSNAPTVLPPGNYYATAPSPLGIGGGTPTGVPIVITNNVVFSDGQSAPCGGFCNYVFFGGLVTGPLSTVTFSPGRYVFAGAQPVAGGPGLDSRIRDCK